MKKTAFFFLLLLFIAHKAYAGACKVEYPGEWRSAFTKLTRGECLTSASEWLEVAQSYFPGAEEVSVLYFDRSMEIIAESPLTLSNTGKPVLILAKDGTQVQFQGWPAGLKNAGLTLRGKNILLKNLAWRDFLGSVLQIEGEDIFLGDLKLLHNGKGEEASLIIKNGKNISVIESEVAHGGLHGITIDETKKVLLKKVDCHHNAGFGVVANGHQIELFKTKVHHHARGGLWIEGVPAGEELHTFKLSQVSFYANAVGILSTAPLMPSPQGLVTTRQGNILHIRGFIPFSYDPGDPWRLGVIHPRELVVELYWSDTQDPAQGKEYITTVESISEEGIFETTIPASSTPGTSLTAVVIDRVLGVSSGFSSGGDRDHDQLDDGEEEDSDPRSADTDLDGLADGEERELGLDPADPDSDSDCLPDGLEKGVRKETLLEWRRLSMSPPQFLKLSAECVMQAGGSGENVILPENGLWPEGLSEEERSWDNLIGLFDSDPETVTDPAQPDSDGDGIKDGDEDKNINGRLDEGETDSARSDPDDDGLNDREELAAETNPNRADSDGDGAGDGLELRQLLSNPLLCDTDRDGLGDGLEGGILHPDGTPENCRGLSTEESNFKQVALLDPLSPDSDQDSVTDGDEDKNRNGWVDSNETDPTLADTDGDGLSDGAEENPNVDLTLLTNGEDCSPPSDKHDLDCDGLINGRDLDSDNDTCLDREEDWGEAWDSKSKSCNGSHATNSSGGSGPSLGNGNPEPDETVEATGPAEVLPAKGGGACQLSGSGGERWSWYFLLYLTISTFGVRCFLKE